MNRSGVDFQSTIPQIIQTGSIICIPLNTKSILLNLSPLTSENRSPKLKSVTDETIIDFVSRAYLYIQSSLPYLVDDHRCFQVDFNSSNVIGQIQFIYERNETSSVKQIDACLTRRIKCKNGGQCQVRANGQTTCLCPDHIAGENCENSTFTIRNRKMK